MWNFNSAWIKGSVIFLLMCVSGIICRQAQAEKVTFQADIVAASCDLAIDGASAVDLGQFDLNHISDTGYAYKFKLSNCSAGGVMPILKVSSNDSINAIQPGAYRAASGTGKGWAYRVWVNANTENEGTEIKDSSKPYIWNPPSGIKNPEDWSPSMYIALSDWEGALEKKETPTAGDVTAAFKVQVAWQ